MRYVWTMWAIVEIARYGLIFGCLYAAYKAWSNAWPVSVAALIIALLLLIAGNRLTYTEGEKTK